MEMSRLTTRDGTAEPVSRDQILRCERGQGNINFLCSADHEQDGPPYPVDPYPCHLTQLILTLAIILCDGRTYINKHCHHHHHFNPFLVLATCYVPTYYFILLLLLYYNNSKLFDIFPRGDWVDSQKV